MNPLHETIAMWGRENRQSYKKQFPWFISVHLNSQCHSLQLLLLLLIIKLALSTIKITYCPAIYFIDFSMCTSISRYLFCVHWMKQKANKKAAILISNIVCALLTEPWSLHSQFHNCLYGCNLQNSLYWSPLSQLYI